MAGKACRSNRANKKYLNCIYCASCFNRISDDSDLSCLIHSISFQSFHGMSVYLTPYTLPPEVPYCIISYVAVASASCTVSEVPAAARLISPECKHEAPFFSKVNLLCFFGSLRKGARICLMLNLSAPGSIESVTPGRKKKRKYYHMTMKIKQAVLEYIPVLRC